MSKKSDIAAQKFLTQRDVEYDGIKLNLRSFKVISTFYWLTWKQIDFGMLNMINITDE